MRILTNTTGSDIFNVEAGLNLAAGQTYTIPVTEYALWVGQIDTEIDSGDIVVNDGTSDLSPVIGKGVINGVVGAQYSVIDKSTTVGAMFQATTVQGALEEVKSAGIIALTDASTITFNAALGLAYTITLGGDRTIANPTGLVPGATYSLRVTQDSTGTRLLTFSDKFYFTGGTAPTLSVTADAIDILTFVSDGTNLYHTSIIKNLKATVSVLACTSLTASTTETAQVTLNWTNNDPSQTGTEIWIDAYGFGFGYLDAVGSGISTYVDPEAAGTYSYYVVAKVSALSSLPSNTAVGTAV